MPIPDYQTLMLPVLRAFAGGEAIKVATILPQLAGQYDLTEAEQAETIPSGTQPLLANRAHWARTYLSKVGLLTSPRRGWRQISEAGQALLARNPERIDNKLLETMPAFRGWRESHAAEDATSVPTPEVPAVETPEERMARAHGELERALAEDLLSLVQAMDPLRFERLILSLLGRMGYGTGPTRSSRLTPVTGDGGFDGIIHEDALGLDAVYIQAKRYAADNIVGRPAIQAFVGALTGEGATKGVFVTSSDFSAEARRFVERVSQRVVLIDGRTLANLMIRHEVGTRARQAYVLRQVDDLWFGDTD